MSDETPSPVFPQYAPPVNPQGTPHLPDPKQQKPLMKLISKRLFSKRVAQPQHKRLAKKKRGEQD